MAVAGLFGCSHVSVRPREGLLMMMNRQNKPLSGEYSWGRFSTYLYVEEKNSKAVCSGDLSRMIQFGYLGAVKRGKQGGLIV